jgi:hypothetical protein
MNKQLSLGKFPKGGLSAIKLPKGISVTQLILIVVGVIILALTIYFAISYFTAVSKKTDLNRDIQLKNQQISNIGGLQNIAALQSQLVDAQQDLIDKSPFPQEVNNIDMAYLIIQAAREANITCFQYTPATEKGAYSINDSTYINNQYGISSTGAGEATGEKTIRIINFLKNLEELPYNTVSISGLSLSDSDRDGTWSVTFSLSILSLH